MVWEDVNGNGLIDGGEPGLPGATIRLYDHEHPSPEPPLQSAVSESDGSFQFEALPPGWYVVAKENPVMYISTTSSELSVLVASGMTSEARFGAQPISVVLPIVIVHGS